MTVADLIILAVALVLVAAAHLPLLDMLAGAFVVMALVRLARGERI